MSQFRHNSVHNLATKESRIAQEKPVNQGLVKYRIRGAERSALVTAHMPNAYLTLSQQLHMERMNERALNSLR